MVASVLAGARRAAVANRAQGDGLPWMPSAIRTTQELLSLAWPASYGRDPAAESWRKSFQGELRRHPGTRALHLRRRDNLAALFTCWSRRLLFNPLVWFIGARLVEELEQACDEAVLG